MMNKKKQNSLKSQVRLFIEYWNQWRAMKYVYVMLIMHFISLMRRKNLLNSYNYMKI